MAMSFIAPMVFSGPIWKDKGYQAILKIHIMRGTNDKTH